MSGRRRNFDVQGVGRTVPSPVGSGIIIQHNRRMLLDDSSTGIAGKPVKRNVLGAGERDRPARIYRGRQDNSASLQERCPARPDWSAGEFFNRGDTAIRLLRRIGERLSVAGLLMKVVYRARLVCYRLDPRDHACAGQTYTGED
jgi:hypothetical protein